MPSQVRIVFNHLPEIAAGMGVKAEQVIQQTAEAIAADARSTVPVLTGSLASSIQARSVGKLHWQITAGERYAAYVEYGTARHGAAQPYMTPAAHQEEPNFQAQMATIIT